MWYKGSVGKITNYDNIQIPKTITKFNYNSKAIFNLQFPQYNVIINYLKNRNNEDGVVVAGTYIQYFLDNQRNLTMDGLLTELWVKISDYDLCKSYWRLKNDHIKYLLIDPNIGSVGMGEGNETLFHRFFAKLGPTQKDIEED
ncbi:MAG: hypothetical protein LBI53_07790 [Candidatus Peribacteria bacterium]|nr:hypothetical protein [Candidatus Peribacteria bacterium]